ncbi:helix-turn-helix domain-containing protein [Streptomyces anulatus]|uniref:ArsR/SmtB family transcription factor n=1 Tax=Streptomyces TaxID=1883 RepID=UPI001BDBC35B|nr:MULTISPECIES: helix-turn-helix domain-containing protein [Streptomyces]MBT1102672.1 helix-turn-helix domain-containing protein [Streptomyces sp. Tu10]WSC65020.1 helix-turn-helix domain-containing protein [Streptomyces anulatus]WSR79376.1 helix-turn-helix domain-containing protein [Streptomyces anulatus]WUC85739.1 helix-turn-helix domain-containing protein [Streptomyces anulatus]
MSDEKRPSASARQPLPDHPVRLALLDLLAETGTVTSTQAAARLGHSSGLCSFHLRQLAKHGLVEEAPHRGGRQRPWRLRWEASPESGQQPPAAFDEIARGLEDESYRHWQEHRHLEPAEWRHEESFSAVVHLTPEETAEVAEAIRLLLAGYRERDEQPSARPAGTRAVAAVTRLFPLPAANTGDTAHTARS